MKPLDELRRNPEAAIMANDFFVDVRGFKTTKSQDRCEIGGACTIKAEKAKNGVTRLNISNGGSDYFFPWVNRGIGECELPLNAPEGTIAVTGGMNGCAFHATRDGAKLRFYHDADNRYLGTLKQAEGDQICRVEPSLYMKIPYGETLMTQMGGGCAYLYQMLVVRHAGKWKVVYSGIIIGPGIDMPVLRSFTPGPSSYLASFEDD